MQPFVHLHNHFLFDSGMRVEDGVRRAAELGQPALAITDHASVALWPRFARACRAAGIKPILGIEAYFVDDAPRAVAQHLNDRYHLILLAKNAAGVKNLLHLVSASAEKYAIDSRVSVVDFALLEQYHAGIIATGACVFGRIPDALWRGDEATAEATLRRYREIFGSDFYLEVATHYFPEQTIANRRLLEMGARHGVTVLAVNDCHFAVQEDWYLQRIIMKTLYGELTSYTIESQECYLKSYDEMAHLGFPEATLTATVTLAGQIDPDLDRALALTAPGDDAPVAVPGRLQTITAADAVKAAGLVLHLPRRERDALAAELDGKTADELARYEKYPSPIFRFAIPRLVGVVRGVEPDPGSVIRGGLAELPCQVSGGVAYAQWEKEDLTAAGFPLQPAKKCPEWETRATRARDLLTAERLLKSRAFDALLELALRLPDDSTGEKDLFRALAFERIRKPDEAERIFVALLQRLPAADPKRFAIHLQHAWNLFHLRRPFEQVAEEFDRAIALAPENPQPHHAKGTLAHRQRKYGIARVALERYCVLVRDGRQYAEARNLLDSMAK